MTASKAGRPPIPDEIKKNKGTLRPGRVKNNADHIPIKELPAPPEFLGASGIQEWNSKIQHLSDIGILAAADLGALSALCKEWQNYVDAEQSCDKNARFYAVKDESGKVKYWGIHPAHTIAQQHLKAYITLCNEFGMTPASRSNVQISKGAALTGVAKQASILDFVKGGSKKAI